MLNKPDCNRFRWQIFILADWSKFPSASEWAWQAKIRQEVKKTQLHLTLAASAAGHSVDWLQLRLIAQQVRRQTH